MSRDATRREKERAEKEKEEETERQDRVRKTVVGVHDRLVYLRHVFECGVPWLNVVKLGATDFSSAGAAAAGAAADPDTARQLSRLFTLGMSLSTTLAIPEPDLFVAALAQLMEEFEHHLSNEESSHPQRVLTSTAAGGMGGSGRHAADISRPRVTTYGECVVYEFLRPLPNPVGASLDYCSVVLALCDILDQAYMRLDSDSCTQRAIFDATVRFDARIQLHFFKFVLRTMGDIGRSIAQANLLDVDTLISHNLKRQQQQQQQQQKQSPAIPPPPAVAPPSKPLPVAGRH